MDLNEQFKKGTKIWIVETAQRILRGDIDAVLGARAIVRSKNDLDNPDDRIFKIFVEFVNVADNRMSHSYKRNKIEDYLLEFKLKEACKDIIAKF